MTQNPFEKRQGSSGDSPRRSEGSENPFSEDYDPADSYTLERPKDSVFAEEDLTTTGEFMKDPTDFSDTVMEQRRKKRIKWTIIGLLAALALAAFVYGVAQIMKPTEVVTAPPDTPVATTDAPAQTKSPQKIAESNNPLLQAYPDAPEVERGIVTLSSDKNVITTSNNHSIIIRDADLTVAATDCSITDPTEFCLAGRLVQSDAEYDIFFMKDAAHSRLFEDPASWTEVSLKNAQVAGILPMNMGSEEESRTGLVIVNSDSSGWLIVLDGESKQRMQDLLAKTTIT